MLEVIKQFFCRHEMKRQDADVEYSMVWISEQRYFPILHKCNKCKKEKIITLDLFPDSVW